MEKLRVLVWGLFEVQGGSEAASRFPVSLCIPWTRNNLEDEINSAVIGPETIADTASDELYNIRRKMRAAENRIRESLQKYKPTAYAAIKDYALQNTLLDIQIQFRNIR